MLLIILLVIILFILWGIFKGPLKQMKNTDIHGFYKDNIHTHNGSLRTNGWKHEIWLSPGDGLYSGNHIVPYDGCLHNWESVDEGKYIDGITVKECTECGLRSYNDILGSYPGRWTRIYNQDMQLKMYLPNSNAIIYDRRW